MFHDLRYAWRLLRRDRAFSVAAILTLALGIGGSTAVFGVLDAVLLRPLIFDDGGRLVRIRETVTPAGGQEARTGATIARFLRVRDLPVLDGAVAQRFTNVAVTGREWTDRAVAVRVSEGWLTTLGVAPALGRGFTDAELAAGREGRAVVVSHGYWQDSLGSPADVLGRLLSIDGEPHTIVGVMPRGFSFPYGAELWLPLSLDAIQDASRDLNVTARLAPGVGLDQLRAALDAVAGQLAREDGTARAGVSRGFNVMPTREDLVGEREGLVGVLGVAVLLLLLVCCANVANLLLARATTRRREMAVRATLGATRGRQLRQLLTETLVLALLGGALGALAAAWIGGALTALIPEAVVQVLPRSGLDPRLFAFALCAVLATALAAGLAPALSANVTDPGASLRHGGRGITGPRRLLSGIAMLEIAMAVALVSAAVLMLRDVDRRLERPLGFQPEGVLTAVVSSPATPRYTDPESRTAAFQQVRERVSAVPGVASAALVNLPPLITANTVSVVEPDGSARVREPLPISNRLVDGPYFQTLRARLLRGRWIGEADTASAQPVVIIGASLARHFWRDADPIGQQIRRAGLPPDPWRTVVGVVDDIYEGRDLAHTWYVPYAQAPGMLGRTWAAAQTTLVVRAAGEPIGLLESIRREVAAVDPALPLFDIATLEERRDTRLGPQRFGSRLLAAAALLAVVFGAIGIYGVLAFAVSQQRREIGLRLALGADPAGITRFYVRRGALIVLLGLGAGTLGAIVLARGLVRFAGLPAVELAPLAAVAACIAAVGLLASYLPARRAGRTDPLSAIQLE